MSVFFWCTSGSCYHCSSIFSLSSFISPFLWLSFSPSFFHTLIIALLRHYFSFFLSRLLYLYRILGSWSIIFVFIIFLVTLIFRFCFILYCWGFINLIFWFDPRVRFSFLSSFFLFYLFFFHPFYFYFLLLLMKIFLFFLPCPFLTYFLCYHSSFYKVNSLAFFVFFFNSSSRCVLRRFP